LTVHFQKELKNASFRASAKEILQKTGMNISHSMHTSEPEEEQWRRKRIFFRLWKDHRRRLLFSAFNLAFFSYSSLFIFFVLQDKSTTVGLYVEVSNIKKDMSKIIMNNVKAKKDWDLESHWEAATRLNIYTLCTVPIYRLTGSFLKNNTHICYFFFFFLTKLATFYIMWQWNLTEYE